MVWGFPCSVTACSASRPDLPDHHARRRVRILRRTPTSEVNVKLNCSKKGAFFEKGGSDGLGAVICILGFFVFRSVIYSFHVELCIGKTHLCDLYSFFISYLS